jgi:hypothetical protein
VVSRPLGGKIVLYNPDAREVSVLNATAAVVWELCDGETPMADAVDRLKARFRSAETRDVEADVTKVLRTLSQRGLLGDSRFSPAEDAVG